MKTEDSTVDTNNNSIFLEAAKNVQEDDSKGQSFANSPAKIGVNLEETCECSSKNDEKQTLIEKEAPGNPIAETSLVEESCLSCDAGENRENLILIDGERIKEKTQLPKDQIDEPVERKFQSIELNKDAEKETLNAEKIADEKLQPVVSSEGKKLMEISEIVIQDQSCEPVDTDKDAERETLNAKKIADEKLQPVVSSEGEKLMEISEIVIQEQSFEPVDTVQNTQGKILKEKDLTTNDLNGDLWVKDTTVEANLLKGEETGKELEKDIDSISEEEKNINQKVKLQKGVALEEETADMNTDNQSVTQGPVDLSPQKDETEPQNTESSSELVLEKDILEFGCNDKNLEKAKTVNIANVNYEESSGSLSGDPSLKKGKTQDQNFEPLENIEASSLPLTMVIESSKKDVLGEKPEKLSDLAPEEKKLGIINLTEELETEVCKELEASGLVSDRQETENKNPKENPDKNFGDSSISTITVDPNIRNNDVKPGKFGHEPAETSTEFEEQNVEKINMRVQIDSENEGKNDGDLPISKITADSNIKDGETKFEMSQKTSESEENETSHSVPGLREIDEREKSPKEENPNENPDALLVSKGSVEESSEKNTDKSFESVSKEKNFETDNARKIADTDIPKDENPDEETDKLFLTKMPAGTSLQKGKAEASYLNLDITEETCSQKEETESKKLEIVSEIVTKEPRKSKISESDNKCIENQEHEEENGKETEHGEPVSASDTVSKIQIVEAASETEKCGEKLDKLSGSVSKEKDLETLISSTFDTHNTEETSIDKDETLGEKPGEVSEAVCDNYQEIEESENTGRKSGDEEKSNNNKFKAEPVTEIRVHESLGKESEMHERVTGLVDEDRDIKTKTETETNRSEIAELTQLGEKLEALESASEKQGIEITDSFEKAENKYIISKDASVDATPIVEEVEETSLKKDEIESTKNENVSEIENVGKDGPTGEELAKQSLETVTEIRAQIEKNSERDTVEEENENVQLEISFGEVSEDQGNETNDEVEAIVTKIPNKEIDNGSVAEETGRTSSREEKTEDKKPENASEFENLDSNVVEITEGTCSQKETSLKRNKEETEQLECEKLEKNHELESQKKIFETTASIENSEAQVPKKEISKTDLQEEETESKKLEITSDFVSEKEIKGIDMNFGSVSVTPVDNQSVSMGPVDISLKKDETEPQGIKSSSKLVFKKEILEIGCNDKSIEEKTANIENLNHDESSGPVGGDPSLEEGETQDRNFKPLQNLQASSLLPTVVRKRSQKDEVGEKLKKLSDLAFEEKNLGIINPNEDIETEVCNEVGASGLVSVGQEIENKNTEENPDKNFGDSSISTITVDPNIRNDDVKSEKLGEEPEETSSTASEEQNVEKINIRVKIEKENEDKNNGDFSITEITANSNIEDGETTFKESEKACEYEENKASHPMHELRETDETEKRPKEENPNENPNSLLVSKGSAEESSENNTNKSFKSGSKEKNFETDGVREIADTKIPKDENPHEETDSEMPAGTSSQKTKAETSNLSLYITEEKCSLEEETESKKLDAVSEIMTDEPEKSKMCESDNKYVEEPKKEETGKETECEDPVSASDTVSEIRVVQVVSETEICREKLDELSGSVSKEKGIEMLISSSFGTQKTEETPVDKEETVGEKLGEVSEVVSEEYHEIDESESTGKESAEEEKSNNKKLDTDPVTEVWFQESLGKDSKMLERVSGLVVEDREIKTKTETETNRSEIAEVTQLGEKYGALEYASEEQRIEIIELNDKAENKYIITKDARVDATFVTEEVEETFLQKEEIESMKLENVSEIGYVGKNSPNREEITKESLETVPEIRAQIQESSKKFKLEKENENRKLERSFGEVSEDQGIETSAETEKKITGIPKNKIDNGSVTEETGRTSLQEQESEGEKPEKSSEFEILDSSNLTETTEGTCSHKEETASLQRNQGETEELEYKIVEKGYKLESWKKNSETVVATENREVEKPKKEILETDLQEEETEGRKLEIASGFVSEKEIDVIDKNLGSVPVGEEMIQESLNREEKQIVKIEAVAPELVSEEQIFESIYPNEEIETKLQNEEIQDKNLDEIDSVVKESSSREEPAKENLATVPVMPIQIEESFERYAVEEEKDNVNLEQSFDVVLEHQCVETITETEGQITEVPDDDIENQSVTEETARTSMQEKLEKASELEIKQENPDKQTQQGIDSIGFDTEGRAGERLQIDKEEQMELKKNQTQDEHLDSSIVAKTTDETYSHNEETVCLQGDKGEIEMEREILEEDNELDTRDKISETVVATENNETETLKKKDISEMGSQKEETEGGTLQIASYLVSGKEIEGIDTKFGSVSVGEERIDKYSKKEENEREKTEATSDLVFEEHIYQKSDLTKDTEIKLKDEENPKTDHDEIQIVGEDSSTMDKNLDRSFNREEPRKENHDTDSNREEPAKVNLGTGSNREEPAKENLNTASNRDPRKKNLDTGSNREEPKKETLDTSSKAEEPAKEILDTGSIREETMQESFDKCSNGELEEENLDTGSRIEPAKESLDTGLIRDETMKESFDKGSTGEETKKENLDMGSNREEPTMENLEKGSNREEPMKENLDNDSNGKEAMKENLDTVSNGEESAKEILDTGSIGEENMDNHNMGSIGEETVKEKLDTGSKREPTKGNLDKGSHTEEPTKENLDMESNPEELVKQNLDTGSNGEEPTKEKHNMGSRQEETRKENHGTGLTREEPINGNLDTGSNIEEAKTENLDTGLKGEPTKENLDPVPMIQAQTVESFERDAVEEETGSTKFERSLDAVSEYQGLETNIEAGTDITEIPNDKIDNRSATEETARTSLQESKTESENSEKALTFDTTMEENLDVLSVKEVSVEKKKRLGEEVKLEQETAKTSVAQERTESPEPDKASGSVSDEQYHENVGASMHKNFEMFMDDQNPDENLDPLTVTETLQKEEREKLQELYDSVSQEEILEKIDAKENIENGRSRDKENERLQARAEHGTEGPKKLARSSDFESEEPSHEKIDKTGSGEIATTENEENPNQNFADLSIPVTTVEETTPRERREVSDFVSDAGIPETQTAVEIATQETEFKVEKLENGSNAASDEKVYEYENISISMLKTDENPSKNLDVLSASQDLNEILQVEGGEKHNETPNLGFEKQSLEKFDASKDTDLEIARDEKTPSSELFAEAAGEACKREEETEIEKLEAAPNLLPEEQVLEMINTNEKPESEIPTNKANPDCSPITEAKTDRSVPEGKPEDPKQLGKDSDLAMAEQSIETIEGTVEKTMQRKGEKLKKFSNMAAEEKILKTMDANESITAASMPEGRIESKVLEKDSGSISCHKIFETIYTSVAEETATPKDDDKTVRSKLEKDSDLALGEQIEVKTNDRNSGETAILENKENPQIKIDSSQEQIRETMDPNLEARFESKYETPKLEETPAAKDLKEESPQKHLNYLTTEGAHAEEIAPNEKINLEKLDKEPAATFKEQSLKVTDLIEETETKITTEEENQDGMPEKPVGTEIVAEELIEESKASDSNKVRLSELLQESLSMKHATAEKSMQMKTLTADEEEVQNKQQSIVRTKGDKMDDKEIDKKEEWSSEAPVMVKVSRDRDRKPVHKKSHNILSSVGSKFKHSVVKVKKAITCKSSHSNTLSPK